MTAQNSHPKLSQVGLLVLLAGQLLPQIDFSIVNVALDAVAHSLHATETGLELMVAAYGVAFAVCLAMGGRLGDTFGRRRIFNAGVLLFGISSLLCGLANSMALLLAARALQGVAAALLVPQILATIHVSLKGHAHSRAIGFYGAIGGLAFIVGQVLGGFLVSANIAGSGWRSVFLINLPVCAAILACSRWIPETRRDHASGIDRPATLLLALLILAILLPLSMGPSLHWSAPCIALLAAAVPLIVLLWKTELVQERRGVSPLLPPTLLRLPSVRFGLVIAILFFSCWSGFMFVLALTLQAGAGLSPVHSGNTLIVLGGSYFVASLFTARAVARFGRTQTLMLGCAIQMPGLLALIATLHTVWPHPGILNLAPATMLIGAGQAFIVSSYYRISLTDVPHEQAGAGSAMLATVQQASFGLGSASLGAVFAQTLHHSGLYLDAVTASLVAEFCVMLVLVVCAAVYRNHDRNVGINVAVTAAQVPVD
ncbi:MFS transporter [Paraburkholderia kururiensis]|uniref:MFS transporter n=1 Tax=Paraburkholderia kururiensis TaxID=984307 RepID=A0ABZ0WNH7_9BURK|nr:MFS transporter [Paraburkholderia kururiensis]WQD78945.1 MFS transporter [Paraburkholderia kururiensis]